MNAARAVLLSRHDLEFFLYVAGRLHRILYESDFLFIRGDTCFCNQ